jgi:hypothetical protein
LIFGDAQIPIGPKPRSTRVSKHLFMGMLEFVANQNGSGETFRRAFDVKDSLVVEKQDMQSRRPQQ